MKKAFILFAVLMMISALMLNAQNIIYVMPNEQATEVLGQMPPIICRPL